MKTVTSITFWNDAVGKRLSITYSEINENGQIIADNKRIDRVVTDKKDINHLEAISEIAQTFVEVVEE